ncbi:MAG: hypothetical protein O7D33_08720 [Chloroflexi bacterium]|nr:hypothetical protein [Chloroflexota bacterium]
MKGAMRDEKGQALVLALMALAAGSILITPFLSSVSTTLLASRKYRTSIVEQYAGDAGIEDALWSVTYGDFGSTVLTSPGDSTSYSLGQPVNGFTPSISVARDKATLASDDFESGGWSGGNGWIGSWSASGEASVLKAGNPHEGSYHLRLRSSTGYVKRAVDLSGQSGLRLQFWAKVESFEPGDQAELLFSPDGAAWTTAKSWTSVDSDNTYRFVDVDLSPYAVSAQFWIAFDAKMSANDDHVFIDDLLLVKIFPGAVLDLPGDDLESGDFSGGSGWLYDWAPIGNVAVLKQGAPHGGAYHLRMRTGDSYVERAADLSSQSGLRLQLWAKVNSLEGADYVEALVSPDHTDWTVVKTWTSADSDNAYHLVDIDLSPYTMTSEFWIAFNSGMNSGNDRFYIDDLKIVGTIAYEIVASSGNGTTKAYVTVNNGNVAILSWQRN